MYLRKCLNAFLNGVKLILNQGPHCFYSSMLRVMQKRWCLTKSSILSLGYTRAVLFPAASKTYKKCQWGIASCRSISKILRHISLLVVNIRPQPRPYFIDYHFSLIKENPKSRSFSWRQIFIYLVARNQIKKITF